MLRALWTKGAPSVCAARGVLREARAGLRARGAPALPSTVPARRGAYLEAWLSSFENARAGIVRCGVRARAIARGATNAANAPLLRARARSRAPSYFSCIRKGSTPRSGACRSGPTLCIRRSSGRARASAPARTRRRQRARCRARARSPSHRRAAAALGTARAARRSLSAAASRTLRALATTRIRCRRRCAAPRSAGAAARRAPRVERAAHATSARCARRALTRPSASRLIPRTSTPPLERCRWYALVQVKALALKVALSDKYASGQLVVLSGYGHAASAPPRHADADSDAPSDATSGQELAAIGQEHSGKTRELYRQLSEGGLRLRVGAQKGAHTRARARARDVRAGLPPNRSVPPTARAQTGPLPLPPGDTARRALTALLLHGGDAEGELVERAASNMPGIQARAASMVCAALAAPTRRKLMRGCLCWVSPAAASTGRCARVISWTGAVAPSHPLRGARRSPPGARRWSVAGAPAGPHLAHAVGCVPLGR